MKPGPLLIASLAGHTTRSSTWTVCASQPGNYLIFARATALDQGGRPLAADSSSVVLVVAGRFKACR